MFDYSHLHQLLTLLKQQGYQHITVSPTTHNIINSREENQLATNLVGALGWSRPFLPETIDPEILACMQSANILQHNENTLSCQIRVSTLQQFYFIHSPYPTKQTEAVFFGPDTYRFTRALNQHFASDSSRVLRAMDICTGCGPGAILIANMFPAAEVYGVDINTSALDFARFNASFNADINSPDKHYQNLNFVNNNLLHDIEGEFDFISANPPFLVDASKRAYRHGGGAYGYQLSLDIIDSALPRLSEGGTLLLYTGVAIVNGIDHFLAEVKAKINSLAFNYSYQEIDPDIFAEELLAGPYLAADRIAAVVMVVKKNMG